MEIEKLQIQFKPGLHISDTYEKMIELARKHDTIVTSSFNNNEIKVNKFSNKKDKVKEYFNRLEKDEIIVTKFKDFKHSIKDNAKLMAKIESSNCWVEIDERDDIDTIKEYMDKEKLKIIFID